MYPHEQLEVLERHKATLRMRITVQRWETAQHLDRVTRPVDLLSRAHARWQALPLAIRMAMGPIAMAIQRALWKRFRIGGTAMLWGPVVWRFAKWAYPLLRSSSLFSSSPDERRIRRLRRLQRRAETLAEQE